MARLESRAGSRRCLLALLTMTVLCCRSQAAAAPPDSVLCQRVLEKKLECEYVYRHDDDHGEARCGAIIGPLLDKCSAHQRWLNAFKKRDRQLRKSASLKIQKKGKSAGKKKSAYNATGYNGAVSVDPWILNACRSIVLGLKKKKLVRYAFLGSAFRSGTEQCTLIKKLRAFLNHIKAKKKKTYPLQAAERSLHPLGLACDVYFRRAKGVRMIRVAVQARLILEEKFGRRGSRGFRMWRESGVGSFHIEPNFFRSKDYFSEVRARNIGKLVSSGVLPAETSRHGTPRCRSYAK